MGKNNRQRRAAKRRKREHSQREAGPRAQPGRDFVDEPRMGSVEMVAELLVVLASRAVHRDRAETEAIRSRLGRFDPAIVAPEAERLLLQIVDLNWRNGWQPVELVRHVRRNTTSAGARLTLRLIAADHARRAADSIDPRWRAQLERLDLPQTKSANGWLGRWPDLEGVSWPVALDIIVQVLQAVAAALPLAVLIPPPGSAPAAFLDLTGPADDPVLERVRALLAQAESTTFEAEAEAFTAKAQELITRHAIDDALLAGPAVRDDAPIAVRIPIDDPYADIKCLLVQVVAEHTRCRAVWDDRHALSTLVGMAHDVAATELLFTSLLVQAQTALNAAARTAPAGSRPRSRGYRSSFLFAYGGRVGERLAEINAHVIAAAEHETGASFMPVLAAHASAVDAKVRELFGELVTSTVRGGVDAAGWAGGRAAADAAALNAGDLPDVRPLAPRALGA